MTKSINHFKLLIPEKLSNSFCLISILCSSFTACNQNDTLTASSLTTNEYYGEINSEYLTSDSPLDYIDLDNDGYTRREGDCDDQNAFIYPNSLEVCDNVDQDCDNETDEGISCPIGFIDTIPTWIGSGGNVSSFIEEDGNIWSAGENSNGQLGDTTTISRASPGQISFLKDIKQISYGKQHALAMTSTSKVYSWGDNTYGQLGNNTAVDSLLPVDLGFILPVKNISSGWFHSLAIIEDGSIKSWGLNTSGQLGNGNKSNQYAPVRVNLLESAIAISAGGLHSLAVLENGDTTSWGDNTYGQLGNNSNASSSEPVSVSGISNSISVATGYLHSMALSSDGTVWAWGANSEGELGDGTFLHKKLPSIISSLSGINKIVAGAYHSIAKDSDGNLWLWGYNEYGQLGDGTHADRNVPTLLEAEELVVDVSAGNNHTFFIDSENDIWAMGNNSYGQLANNTTIDYPEPVKISTSTYPVAVSAGAFHTMSLTSTGKLYAWGSNDRGQLGVPGNTPKLYPVLVPGVQHVISAGAGAKHSLALLSTNTLLSWGANSYGQLGIGTDQVPMSSTPLPVISMTEVLSIAVGGNHSMAQKIDGTLWAWGLNTSGQLGIDSYDNQSLAKEIYLEASPSIITSGWNTSFIIDMDGYLWGFGANDHFQIGTSSSEISYSKPTLVSAINDVVSVEAGWYHTLALKNDGTLWAWGWNNYGQTGIDVSNTSIQVPTKIELLEEIYSIDAGGLYSFAIKRDGSIWAWGYNEHGELGIGNNTNQNFPTKVLNGSIFNLISAGSFHSSSISILNNNSVYTWGYNNYGQLGDGTTVSKNVPSTISIE